MSETITVTADNIIEINPMYLFRWEEPQQAHVLLYPEGVVKVNETGAAILKLCNGINTVAEVISELNDKYTTDVTDSIYKFLEVAHAKGWIRIKS
ncbi:MAG: pyrroloquinoline quinone biosynthesis peptide chaperone PqqD [Gammaproteobacteria bacterium]